MASAADEVAPQQGAVGRGSVLLFAVTIVLNAALLFSVEPMVTRLVLPLLGGAPSVWNTALMFFQGVLLAGYLYAHVGTRWPLARQLGVHVALVVLSLVLLPLRLTTAGSPPTGGAPIGWLVLTMLLTVGGPFAVLSSAAPLLQHWFATGSRGRRDPFVLYAASNFGSLVALLAYPLLLEPAFTLRAQRVGWSAAYSAVAILVCGCAAWTWRRGSRTVITFDAPNADPVVDPPLSWRQRLRWLALSAVPSSLLLATTGFITTDIASAPLLWVLPLALYLLTFVIAFARSGHTVPALLQYAVAYSLVGAAIVLGWGVRFPGLWPIAFFCALLFVVSWGCHASLAAERPGARRLTEYYLLVSVGGLVGSAFVVLVAPLLFNRITEYPIALVAAALLRPGTPAAGVPDDSTGEAPDPSPSRFDLRRDGGFALVVLAVVLLGTVFGALDDIASPSGMLLAIGAGLALTLVAGRPMRFGLAFAALLLGPTAYRWMQPSDSLQHISRSFFGVYRVVRDDQFTRLLHGTTVHGIQARDPALRLRPASYYEPSGPMGALLGGRQAGTPPRSVGLVGLGVGSLACYGGRDERWTFYEIDPEVVRIASDPRLFTYLRDCPPAKQYVLGDARESLRRVPAGTFDVLVLDAFSSDAIPVHLMTREAFGVYLRALRPDGVLAVHISNLYLDLEPVVAAQAMAHGLQARIWYDLDDSAERRKRGWFSSTWVVLARTDGPLDTFSRTKDWRPLRAPGALWTDDYSNLVGTLKR